MSFFPGLGLAYWDQVALAVKDILDTDETMRGFFSGSTARPALDPTGTVDITPGSTSMVGTGSNWLTTLSPGMRFVAVDQVVQIATVSSDASATIKVAHADGAISANGDRLFRAPRSERVNHTDLIVDLGMPYYTVGVGVLPTVDPKPGALQVDPSVTITVVFPRQEQVLSDDDASWYGVAGHILEILVPEKGVNNAIQRLCVPRFGNEALVDRFATFGAGDGAVLADGDGTIVLTPTIEISWQGRDPRRAQQIPQRW